MKPSKANPKTEVEMSLLGRLLAVARETRQGSQTFMAAVAARYELIYERRLAKLQARLKGR